MDKVKILVSSDRGRLVDLVQDLVKKNTIIHISYSTTVDRQDGGPHTMLTREIKYSCLVIYREKSDL